MATLAYFDMFDYPLRSEEIFNFLQSACDAAEFESSLSQLMGDYLIFKTGNFYSLRNDHSLLKRRENGNLKAASMLVKGYKAAAIVAGFPFVKGVAISGSLSKNFADDASDIDLFIITSANRLWVSRTFLHVFKKVTFLFRLQHYFCMNYFIDESKLTILEKNIYTATEVVTLKPVLGATAFEEFYKSNLWVKKLLPNHPDQSDRPVASKNNRIKFIVEKIFNNRLGNFIDDFLMRLTIRSWRKKSRDKKRNSRGLIMGMHADKHFSKPDPVNFQYRLLKHYEDSLALISDRYETLLVNQ